MPTKWRGPMTRREIAVFWARHGTVEDKFWARVERGPGCWLWEGATTTWGYGTIKADGQMRAAHRLSWEIHNGPIPPGLQVCHRCDVRNCVNPTHLFLGTAKDNAADMNAKGRHGRGWKAVRRGEHHQAAKLSDAQVIEMRAAIAAGEVHRSIARRFGVSHTYVYKLARGLVRVG